MSAPVNFIVDSDTAVLDCGHEELFGDEAGSMISSGLALQWTAKSRSAGSMH
jgi:hypothetical protein